MSRPNRGINFELTLVIFSLLVKFKLLLNSQILTRPSGHLVTLTSQLKPNERNDRDRYT